MKSELSLRMALLFEKQLLFQNEKNHFLDADETEMLAMAPTFLDFGSKWCFFFFFEAQALRNLAFSCILEKKTVRHTF